MLKGEVRSLTGTHDVLWPESERWERLISGFAQHVRSYGFRLLITPVIEETRLFSRGIGEESDVVGKEMYVFQDRGGRSVTLRPEGTAPVVRSFIQHRPPVPWKVWYVTPAFRYERPQAGRYRQHHQLGVEVIGSSSPAVDVEVIECAVRFVEGLGITGTRLLLNSMGCRDCRPDYEEQLRNYLAALPGSAEAREEIGGANALCEYHAATYREAPLRVLDCKRESCRRSTGDAPRLAAGLCDACREHASFVTAGLDALGVNYERDHRLVRGFDYYTRTTFEFVSPALDAAQDAIGGGGRYDGLSEILGGPAAPSIGFGIGIERLLLASDAGKGAGEGGGSDRIFVADLTAGSAQLTVASELRRAGFSVDCSFEERSLKGLLRTADGLGAAAALIIGRRELDDGTVTVKPLRGQGEQVTVPRGEMVAAIGRLVRAPVGRDAGPADS